MTKKTLLLILSLTLIMQSFFGSLAVSAAETKLNYNLSELNASVSGFLGTTEDGRYVVDDVLVFNFPDMKNKQFNKFVINYTASDIVRGTITYKTTGNSTITEEFFLESGDKTDFSSLLDETKVIDGKNTGNIIGIKPLQLTFEPIRENKKIAFNLHSMNTEMGHRPVNDTMYIENDRFKVGVYMAWGGGINYIEDKADNDDTVTNMLNSRDTGRLVQQSYYGTTKKPYECAKYGNTIWGYNPVQGGDQYNNKSKLIDFKVTEDTIFIKCRPLDWAKNNVPTYVYMENTYSLKEDYIEVDNRYIDFSTYDHSKNSRHQELPAFYTISYLDTFTFYNGTKPWTNDSLTSKNDLPFWGDAKNQKKCYFNLDKTNTETWCAWNSSETGYGIGLYTPQIELFLAGRYEFNSSKEANALATNYVAPLITTTMKNFVPFEYSYIITTGDVNSIRNTFTAHKDEFNWKDKNNQAGHTPVSDSFEFTPAAESDRVPQLEINDEKDVELTATPAGTSENGSTNFLTILIVLGIGAVIVASLVIFIVVSSLNKIRKLESMDNQNDDAS
ncbi:MAG: hypothetical protein E7384_03010 [Ruminococcaceae bacterium]|nr:hypothetical protein [Oscillospiraceae bacterium]